MLNSLRKQSGGILAKLLMIFLALTFVVWGIGDIARSGGNQTMAKVGGIKISQAAFEKELNQKLEGFRRMLGANYSPDLVKNLGIELQVLNDLVNNQMLSLEAEAIGFSMSDEEVFRQIRAIPAFQDQNGKFDKAILANALRNMGMTEQELVENIRRDAQNNLVIQSVANVVFTPGRLAHLTYQARNEERVVDILTISERQLANIPAPTEEALIAYHQQHADDYTAAELRKASYVVLSKATAGSEEAFYTLRTLAQDELAGGATLEEVADKLKLSLKTTGSFTALGEGSNGKRLTSLPAFSDFVKNVFTIAPGESTDPIPVDNDTAYIVRLDEVSPATLRPFTEVKNEVSKAWFIEEKRKQLEILAKNIANELTKAADKKQVIAERRVPVTSSTRFTRASAKFANSTTPPQKFFENVFAIASGDSTDAYPLTNGNYVIGVVKQIITPKAATDIKAIEPVARELVDTYQQEIAEQYMRHLREKYSVSINDEALQASKE